MFGRRFLACIGLVVLCLRTKAQDSPPYVSGLEAAGPYVFAYGLSALVHVYDAETGDLVTRLNRHAYDIALSPDGRTLATAGGGVSLWELSTVLAP